MALEFVIIGAHKAGTTWLYDQLRQINSICLPPIKELHYFDRDPDYISPNTISETNFARRMLSGKWRWTAAKDFLRLFRDGGSWQDVRFLTRWHMLDYSDVVYKELFDTWQPDKISGEITPAYSLLDVVDIQRMKDINPDLKVVFQLRDPIERGWSHCRYFRRDVVTDILDTEKFINGQDFSLRGDYVRTIDNFTKVFQDENVLLTCFDGIIEHPKSLLKGIVSFLGGDTEEVEGLNSLNRKSNASKPRQIPEEVLDILKSKYKENMSWLGHKYGSYPALWYNRYFEDKIDVDNLMFCFHPRK